MAEPVPADEAGAELAVTRPHLPALTDLLDGHTVPLPAILALDEDQFRAFALEVARWRRITEGGRLVVGAYLHRRRAAFKRGEWTPFVDELALAMDVKTETLGRWMLKAESHFGLELTHSAKPSLRGQRPKPLPSPAPNADDQPAAGGVATPPAGRGGSHHQPAPAAAPGGDDSPGAGATLEPPSTSRVASPAGRSAQRGERQPGPAGAASGVQPSEDLDPVTDALAELMAAPSVVLAIVARDHRGTVLAVQRALAQALTDSESRPPRGGLRPAATAPVALSRAACEHPREERQVKSYATICGACGVRIR